MASIYRVTRRVSGSPGAPSSLKTAQIAYNMVDGLFYVGFGDDGSGNATSIKVFAKDDYVDPDTVFQPLDTDLTNFAALDSTAGILVKAGANSYTRRTLTGTSGRITVADGTGVSADPTIDLATVSVGSNTAGGSTKFTVDSYGRISNASQASLSDLSSPTGDFSFGGYKITNVAEPVAGTDAATRNYVDTLITGADDKPSVRVATTADISLSGTQTIDGVSLNVSDRVLVKNQTAPEENGLYVVAAGAWTRAADANTWAELVGARVSVEEGTTHADQLWLATGNSGGTLGVTAIAWAGIGTVTGFTTAGSGLSDGGGGVINVVAGTGITLSGDAVGLTGQALALHNISTAADKLIYATGSGTFATTDFTSVARTLVSQTTQSDMRTTGLGLGTMATQNASSVAITGGTIDNITLDGGTF